MLRTAYHSDAFQADEVLQVRIHPDLLAGFLIRQPQLFIADQHTQHHENYYGQCAKMILWKNLCLHQACHMR
jgi:hypothetical protein